MNHKISLAKDRLRRQIARFEQLIASSHLIMLSLTNDDEPIPNLKETTKDHLEEYLPDLMVHLNEMLPKYKSQLKLLEEGYHD